MEKTIKFNLNFDGKTIRTLEELKDNFFIEDVLKCYRNGLLHRWLSDREYAEELEKVKSITESEDLPLIKRLSDIFEVEFDEAIVSEYEKQSKKVSSIKPSPEPANSDSSSGYQQRTLDSFERYQQSISNAQERYLFLVDTIVENKTDIAKIKVAITEIDKYYYFMYELNYIDLFYRFREDAPAAIFVMLMNERMRQKYLPIQTIDEHGKYVTDLNKDKVKKCMYDHIIKLTTTDSLRKILGENLIEFSAGYTKGDWKTVESKRKRYLILKKMQEFGIRSAGVSGGEIWTDKCQFVILNGIDYKSSYSKNTLFYMEV
ncbi:MAG: hypothetical protein LBS41_03805 [Streptococcaceae bacterium]|jgi:hypothetical protein|nr:hypothetical protein [Streptococcaceae bacterium]